MAWSNTGCEVILSKSCSTGLAADYGVGGMRCKVYATTTTTVKEIRGLTQSAAMNLVEENEECSKIAFRTTHGLAWAVVPALIGKEKHVEARRVNEAGGWAVTVTESVTDATASWEDVSEA